MPGLLHIYDDEVNFAMRGSYQAKSADEIRAIGGGTAGFVKALDDLVRQGKTFDSFLVNTHGNEGRIYFAHEPIYDTSWKKLAGRGYERLFPTGAKIYFTGCNVAESGSGWQFLAEAGKLFLQRAGGYVLGHDSTGFAIGGPVGRAAVIALEHVIAGPFAGPVTDVLTWIGLKGKTVHPWGETRGYYIAPGGFALSRFVLE